MKKKIVIVGALLLLFCFALFIRIYFCYGKVFSDPIKYAADDAVYHMRLVENELLGGHFPHRIYFDPYTYFPKGTYEFFAPLYDQLLAFIIWIVSWGRPTLEIINKIAPFYPAVLGSLMVFIVYLIGKTIWSRKIGLVSAFLISFSSPFLYRSILGNNDHHVAEVLFSSIAMLFLFLALKARKDPDNTGLGWKNQIKKEWTDNKKFWLFILLAGLSFGLYFLTWIGAVLFLFILFSFLILYYLFGYFGGKAQNWILISGIIIFLIVLAMISPFLDHPDIFNANMYNIRHIIALALGILGFIVAGISVKIILKKKWNKWIILSFFFSAPILLAVALKIFSPYFLDRTMDLFRGINLGAASNKYARGLTAEMNPMNWMVAINYFSAIFCLALISLLAIIYKVFQRREEKYVLLSIWTIIILLVSGIIPAFGQSRFGYYLAVNICLLAGFLIVSGIEWGWKGLRLFREGGASDARRKSYILAGSILVIFNIIFFVFFPFPINLGEQYPKNLPIIFQTMFDNAKAGPFMVEDDWYDALRWLRENTPDPGVDYYALYVEPGVDKKTGEINPYSYPPSAYGVLAPWSNGHMITYYAHRMPTANPFQQGVGKKEGGQVLELGEAIFFTETDESKATGYLDNLKTRYVITDRLIADPDKLFTYLVKWVQGDLEGYLETDKSTEAPSKFDNSMVARLHLLDGTATQTTREIDGRTLHFDIKALNRLRLVYESSRITVDPLKVTNNTHNVKIFEYVKGAKISGTAKFGTKVLLSAEVETNQQRKFTYKQEIDAKDGYFEFTVPYSTIKQGEWLAGQTKSAVFAQPYKIKAGGEEAVVNVSEKNTIEGETIEINI